MLRKHLKETLYDPVTGTTVLVTREFVAFVRNSNVVTVFTIDEFYKPGGRHERCYPIDVNEDMLRDIEQSEEWDVSPEESEHEVAATAQSQVW